MMLDMTDAERDWAVGPPSEMLDGKSVRAWLGISAITYRRWCADGTLPGAVDYGGPVGYRVPRSSVLRWLRDRQVTPAPRAS